MKRAGVLLGALFLAGCAGSVSGPEVGALPANLDPSLAQLIEETRHAASDPSKISAAFGRLVRTHDLDERDLLTWSGLSTDLADVEVWAELLGDARSRNAAVVLQQGADLNPGTSALRVLLFGFDGSLLDRMDFVAGSLDARVISAFMETEEGESLIGIGAMPGPSGKPDRLDVTHRGRSATVHPDRRDIALGAAPWCCVIEARDGQLHLLIPDRK